MINSITIFTPFITIITTIIILFITISIKRNNLISCFITIIGLIITIISILVFKNNINYDYLFVYNNYYNFFSIILLLISIITCIIAYPWLNKLIHNKDEFYLLIIIISLGGIVLNYTNNFILMLVGLELISIPMFGLIIYNVGSKQSLESSIKYTILSIISSSCLILGISLIYIEYGNLNFINLTNVMINMYNSNNHIHLDIIGICFILFSLGFKLSIVPFHLWTPDIYEGSPTIVTMFLSTFSKTVIFILLHKLLICFYMSYTNQIIIYKILLLLSILSIIFGNIMALTQINIKRILGYSSISHMGYLLTILLYNRINLQNNTVILTTIGIYIISYIINNIGIFGVMSLHSQNVSHYDKYHTDNIYNYRGLFWYNPLYAFILTIMLFSLAGIPISIGFIAKFYIMYLNLYMGIWYLIFILILGSIIGLYYYLRIIISLYLIPPTIHTMNINKKFKKTHNTLLIEIILLLLTILTIIFGLYPEPIIQIIKRLI
ncbi:NADH-quinone oxidoreductase subunit N [Enterobacteriaceae endosymbiont of Neohaemonia nigricornis]|uniref:NADH-quinone oxidoreductase subunit N n=1 Tax=Enterobacteriaceae endosymbiont of Neohaemonia nigricornis TaxID=2675792 RepID=UPI00144A0E4D|nr:NADH-quinone oxidoreductase subunit N [Enterobacteriaceae endosymbiont of Neohaemonia nigricornis]QJC30542.1 NADH-quinone oxidoreductase subunit NuoN [Enterobacteriaceae endosymbiont of Neohaemonia nigricornis]